VTRFISLARAACCTSFALLLAGACGGQSFKGGEGDAGSGGTAQTSGGKATGGGNSGRSGSGTTAGTGSAIDREACTGPSALDASCAAAFLRWTHDATTGLCMPIWYGGCGATKNNYETLAACQQACSGGNPNYDTCQIATDCTLRGNGCCGVCDGPNVTAHDFIAYNKQYAAQLESCPDIACGACPPVEPWQNTRQFFVPNCVRGECVVEDIRESDVTACQTAADCRLRNGTSCCEGCGNGDFVAVRNDGSFTELVCGGFIPPCDPCATVAPVGAVAQCSPEGHCSVAYVVKDDETP
jgi:hypothetical protein